MTPQTLALIEAAEEVVNEWNQEHHGLALLRAVHKLEVAISSAKAAEEGVETVYVVEIDDGTGYGPPMFGARHDNLPDAEAKVVRVLAAQHGSVKATRILCEQKYSTVIEVREKEGL